MAKEEKGTEIETIEEEMIEIETIEGEMIETEAEIGTEIGRETREEDIETLEKGQKIKEEVEFFWSDNYLENN